MKKILPIIIAALTFAGGAKAQTTTTIFDSGNGRSPYYRIPAILNQNGTLWAFTDDRSNVSSTVSWGDIGCGAISIIAKKSTDNGASWSSSTTVAEGSNSASGFYKAHGDAAVVCDREDPNKMLVMCASGEKSYGSSTVSVTRTWNIWRYTYDLDLSSAIRVGKYTSTDGGAKWNGDDVTTRIYGIWDEANKTTYNNGNTNVPVTKLFFSSGRICQSARIKNGSNYRLYAALCSNKGSLVVYSDNFGESWSALGGTDTWPVLSGDEAKIEELPNGNVLLSCRMSTTSSKTSGRYFNIFKYTDQSSATGSWGTAVTSDSSSDGTYAYWNNTNGEILLVPAMAKDSNVPVYIALQSVPAGNTKNTTDQNTYKRSNVSIYWKVLNSTSDLDTPSDFTNGWTKYEVSSTTSAYSSMVLDKKGDVAFIYEENAINTTIGGSVNSGNMDYYDIQFKSLPLSTITNGAYTYTTAKDVDTHRTAFLNNTTIDDSGETADPWAGKIVTLKHTITVNGKTTERYLCNEGLKLTLESASDTDKPDYNKYWVISKDPEGSYYYLSSLNGDGYLGAANGTPLGDGSGSVVIGGDVVCTDNYISEFRITDFVKTFCYESGYENVTATHTDGWAIKFIIRYADKTYDEERVLVIATDGTINWSKHTQNPNTENGNTWSSEFIITEVGKASAVNDYGTFASPTHFGFPVKMTRSNNGTADTDKEGYYYYATLKLPFAVDITSAKDASGTPYTLEVLQCTTPKDKPGEEVILSDITSDLTKNTLPRETPVILRMGNQRSAADDATQIILYLQPALAQNIITTTGLKGSLGKKTFQNTDNTAADYYDPTKNANFFILGKKTDGRVKFYYMSNQVLAANKAYYVYNGSTPAKSLVFRFDDDNISTGISLPETIETTSDAVIYDLSGRRVAGTAKKGVYIRNGKKYIVK